jgi:phage head maturation protease
VSLLADVSVVLTPAYPSSSVSVAMRSYETWLATQSEQASPPAVRSAMRGVAQAWAAMLRLRNV